jgi:hypothetical protein
LQILEIGAIDRLLFLVVSSSGILPFANFIDPVVDLQPPFGCGASRQVAIDDVNEPVVVIAIIVIIIICIIPL